MSQGTEREQPTAAVRPDSQNLGWLLSTLLRQYLKDAGEAVAELPGGPRGFQVLSIAADGSCRNQAGIAEHVGIDRTVMTYLLDDLEQAQLIERRPDPADRRSRQVALTAKGRRTLTTLTHRIAQVEATLLSDLTADEADELRSLLRRATATADADVVEHGDACTVPDPLGSPDPA